MQTPIPAKPNLPDAKRFNVHPFPVAPSKALISNNWLGVVIFLKSEKTTAIKRAKMERQVYLVLGFM